jgi:hypothetical protein
MSLLRDVLRFLRGSAVGPKPSSEARGSRRSPAALHARPRFRPVLEGLESRLVPSFTTTTLPLNNLTGLDVGKHSLWVAGFSLANHLVLNSGGHFEDAGNEKVPVWNIDKGFTVTLDRPLAGGVLFFYVTPGHTPPAALNFGVQPALPPFQHGQDNVPFLNDFVEFTVDGDGTLHIDTSQVTQFGLPLTLTASGSGQLGQVGVTLTPPAVVTRKAIGDAFTAFMNSQPNGKDFLPLKYLYPPNAVEGQYFTILNPDKYLSNPQHQHGHLDTFWDDTLAALFSAGGPKLSLQGIGTPSLPGGEVFEGAVVTLSGDHRALKLTGQSSGQVYYIFDPRTPEFSTSETATEMVFGNDGVFADTRPAAVNGGNVAVALNLQQQVAAALNRGVALAAPYVPGTGSSSKYWGTEANWYAAGVYNVFAKFLHQATIGGVLIFVDGRAYGFGYDENPGPVPPAPAGQPPVPSKFDPVPVGTTTVTITLGPW